MPENDTTDEPAADDILYSTTDDGLPFAYRRGQVITTQVRRALEILRRLDGNGDRNGSGEPGGAGAGLSYQKIDAQPGEEDNLGDEPNAVPSEAETPVAAKWYEPGEEEPDPDDPTADPESDGPFFLVRGVRDPLRAVMELRLHGILAQVNYVYFSHAPRPLNARASASDTSLSASPVYASPVYASPVYASPVYASPVYASPVYASPVYASPVYASPVYASPVDSTDAVPSTSSAVPAQSGHTTHSIWSLLDESAKPGARIFVLDTGLAAAATISPRLAALFTAPNPIRPLRPSDATDHPRAGSSPYLAPAAGHGTFIAGLINQVVPGCRVSVGKVLENTGEGDEWTIARRIHHLAQALAHHPNPDEAKQSILSLSFGAPVLDHPHLLAKVVSDIQALGVVVVASAGNDAMSRPVFPAALPNVVGVGALGPFGPASFSNFGAWVSACAPGSTW